MKRFLLGGALVLGVWVAYEVWKNPHGDRGGVKVPVPRPATLHPDTDHHVYQPQPGDVFDVLLDTDPTYLEPDERNFGHYMQDGIRFPYPTG